MMRVQKLALLCCAVTALLAAPAFSQATQLKIGFVGAPTCVLASTTGQERLLTYRIRVTNPSPSTPANNLVVSDLIPFGTTFRASDPSTLCGPPGASATGCFTNNLCGVTFRFDRLLPGDFKEFAMTVLLPSATGQIVNLASVVADDLGTDNWAFKQTSVVPGPCPIIPPPPPPTYVPTLTKFYTLAACRVFDTRDKTGSPTIIAASARLFPIAGRCAVPGTATAISANVTVVNPAAGGSISLFPGDTEPTNASAVSFAPGVVRANNGIFLLSTDGTGTIGVYNPTTGSVDVLLDVNGYFR